MHENTNSPVTQGASEAENTYHWDCETIRRLRARSHGPRPAELHASEVRESILRARAHQRQTRMSTLHFVEQNSGGNDLTLLGGGRTQELGCIRKMENYLMNNEDELTINIFKTSS